MKQVPFVVIAQRGKLVEEHGGGLARQFKLMSSVKWASQLVASESQQSPEHSETTRVRSLNNLRYVEQFARRRLLPAGREPAQEFRKDDRLFVANTHQNRIVEFAEPLDDLAPLTVASCGKNGNGRQPTR